MKLTEITQQKMPPEMVIKEIRQHSAPFIHLLKKCTNDFKLYRGMAPGESNDDYIDTKHLVRIKNVRADRQPQNTPEDIHKLLDHLFEKYWGYKFRSSSVFCTPYKNDASGYGDIHVIYPIGNFQYVWSPSIADLYDVFEMKVRLFLEYKGMAGIKEKRFHPETMEAIKNFVKEHANNDLDSYLIDYTTDEMAPVLEAMVKNEYTNRHICSNIKSEVMVACKTYYAIDIEHGEQPYEDL